MCLTLFMSKELFGYFSDHYHLKYDTVSFKLDSIFKHFFQHSFVQWHRGKLNRYFHFTILNWVQLAFFSVIFKVQFHTNT